MIKRVQIIIKQFYSQKYHCDIVLISLVACQVGSSAACAIYNYWLVKLFNRVLLSIVHFRLMNISVIMLSREVICLAHGSR